MTILAAHLRFIRNFTPNHTSRVVGSRTRRHHPHSTSFPVHSCIFFTRRQFSF